jgi:capsular polysaccharide biosynthesis protein
LNNPEQQPDWPVGLESGMSEQLWAYDDLAVDDDQQGVDPTAEFVSLPFIRQALKRRKRFWLTVGILGLVIGSALFVKFPPAYKATTTVLLKNGPAVAQGEQILTDTALAQSDALAQRAVTQLHLSESPGAFLASYTVMAVTDQTLTFTVSGPSPAEAVRRASALATAFLQLRKNFALTQQQQQATQLNQQVTQALQEVQSLTHQISQLQGQPGTKSEISSLQAKLNSATITVNTVEEYRSAQEATTATGTRAMIADSMVIDAASAEQTSHIKRPATYVGGGLIGGLAVGMAIVIVSAVISDRLRRRDDVAAAMGVPVRLSVGPLDKGRVPVGRRSRVAETNGQRVAEYLRGAIPSGSRNAALAVVPVDNARTAAAPLVQVARMAADVQKRVILADLCEGTPAANMLGVTAPGFTQARVNHGSILVFVPDPREIAPTGPVGGDAGISGSMNESAELLSAWRNADLLLSLVSLDPSNGSEHLATWATAVVAMVAAGRSSVTRLGAVGEMIRMAGVRMASVILIDADKTDETLGVGAASQSQSVRASQS